MLEKITVLVIVYTAIFIHDGPKLKKNAAGVPERFAYGLLILGTLYLSFIFVFEQDLPNLNDLFHFFLEAPGKRIVEAVKLPPEG